MDSETQRLRASPLSGSDPTPRVGGAMADADSQSVSVARLVRSQQEVRQLEQHVEKLRGADAEQAKGTATLKCATDAHAEQMASPR